MDKARKLVEDGQRKAMLTTDSRMRDEIIKQIKEKIKILIKC